MVSGRRARFILGVCCTRDLAPSHCGAHPHFHSDAHFLWPVEVSERAVLEEPSCGVFPLGVLQACLHGVPCKLFTTPARFCSVSGTRFTVFVVYTPVSGAKRCSSDSVVLPAILHGRISRLLGPALFRLESLHWETRLHGTVLPLRTSSLLVRFPETILKRRLLVAFHVVPCKQPSSVSHQPRPHVHGGCHFCRGTFFQLETQASNLTFHCVLCSPNCTDALTAESWCCLNLELNSICACSQPRSCLPTTSTRVLDQPSELLSHTPSA